MLLHLFTDLPTDYKPARVARVRKTNTTTTTTYRSRFQFITHWIGYSSRVISDKVCIACTSTVICMWLWSLVLAPSRVTLAYHPEYIDLLWALATFTDLLVSFAYFSSPPGVSRVDLVEESEWMAKMMLSLVSAETTYTSSPCCCCCCCCCYCYCYYSCTALGGWLELHIRRHLLYCNNSSGWK